jgi:putative ABC transport system permease protein
MIRFLFKGLLRDRHRSVLPILVVTFGVMLTVVVHCWIKGVLGDMVDFTARFSTGHVKVMTRAYSENADQIPNDLAIYDLPALMEKLNQDYPAISWAPRIRFAGILDVPDSSGETRSQGPVSGMAIDLISPASREKERLNLKQSLVEGKMPAHPNEVLLSEDFAKKLQVQAGDVITLISSGMFGGMAIDNFYITGTIRFGVSMLDKTGMVADIRGIQHALNMEDASGEVLGFFRNMTYNDELANATTLAFNQKYSQPDDEFSPRMVPLKKQTNMAGILDMIDHMQGIIVGVFMLAMSIVLWNAGLIGGLRRYGEIGLRLAIGENKNHIYKTMLYESFLIGCIGSLAGTLIGVSLSLWGQKEGLDISHMLKNATMMMPGTFRTVVTPAAYYIGFVPGILSTVLGTSLSGIGIYKRKTSQLFKELET